MEHTPIPWTDPRHYTKPDGVVYGIQSYGGSQPLRSIFLITEPDDTDEANAAFIVKAVNNHQKLLDALTGLLDQADETYPHFEDTRGMANRDQARAAIKEASKEAS